MKHTDKKTDTRKIAVICGMSALSLAVLAGAYFLTRESAEEFVPSSITEDTATETWKENAGTDVQSSIDNPDEPIQIEGTTEDQTQVIISEDDSGSIISLSNSTTRKDSEVGKPEQPPEGAVFDDEEEAAKSSTPDTTKAEAASTQPVEAEHAGQVYDPVFGWIAVGNTQQDIVDSSGDIHKQIGSMGGS